ncbi:hypothetical protein [Mesorhizobium sp.]|nr:hypothetical protein [Mesorhizobium sp.]RWO38890.1 MAG: hypothetical protein EOS13_34235 [Mesorhizobium sp.]TIN23239.1 MAG: hypothetical protein E5Y19_28325 [Mesorhizobium sp.]TIN33633.1 MAG: hypothetical protein E5Y13_32045 [Mesorhizobium sp.]TJU73864.1 MAG: hypothetical protein E5Y15_32225 [Mesorhizobium sp.]TJU84213.1 MAG: hypothetical protein E5Y10_31245 [Mesorhizobium sp.]
MAVSERREGGGALPDIVEKVKEACNVPGFAVGGGAWRQRDWGRLQVGVEKVRFQVLSVYHSILPERSLRRLGGSETPQNCWLSAESWGTVAGSEGAFLLSVSPYSPKLGTAPFYSLAFPH